MTSLGDIVTVIVFGAGDAAALVGAYATDPYFTTTGVALEATETLAIRADEFTEIRRRLPAVNEAVVRFLADRTLALADQLVEALYVPADTRVLKRLAVLCGLYDRGDDEVVIPLTQEDLAGLAGVTRPTVNRVLKKEERRGTLRISRGSITVADKERLATRSR
jgi:CRP-like cAMP-binding protein